MRFNISYFLHKRNTWHRVALRLINLSATLRKLMITGLGWNTQRNVAHITYVFECFSSLSETVARLKFTLFATT